MVILYCIYVCNCQNVKKYDDSEGPGHDSVDKFPALQRLGLVACTVILTSVTRSKDRQILGAHSWTVKPITKCQVH